MYDIPFVHVLNAFTNLSHVIDNFSFGHCIAFGCYSFK